MPAQDLKKQEQALKVFNMTPTIPSNNSHEQLMSRAEDSVEEDAAGGPAEPSIRSVRKREWISIFILCFVNLINYMDRYTLAGILDDVQKHFDIDNAKGGLLQTSFVISYMVFAPLFGYLGDRYSRRYIMVGGVFLWSLTTLLGSFMNNFTFFILFRALVGIGEASYSTIAPTIISDLFVKNLRSKMLALFYFAIPVGSGLGYIVGSTTANVLGEWQYALRVTPALGMIACVLILFVLQDPERGQSEGSGHMHAGALKDDIKSLMTNGSFLLSTAGFTCVAFVAGALAWWGPKLIDLGMRLHYGKSNLNEVALKFGIIAMMTGVIGVPLGSFIAQRLRPRYSCIDPHVCAAGLLISAPAVFMVMVVAPYSENWCYVFVFAGMVTLNLTWSVVADILLYVVVPTRRSTAEGFQLLVSHALGDAGSPYLIGVVSEALKTSLGETSEGNDDAADFYGLQYALFITCFVEVLGGVFFLLNAFYIVDDRKRVEKAIKAPHSVEPTHYAASDPEQSSLMS